MHQEAAAWLVRMQTVLCVSLYVSVFAFYGNIFFGGAAREYYGDPSYIGHLTSVKINMSIGPMDVSLHA